MIYNLQRHVRWQILKEGGLEWRPSFVWSEVQLPIALWTFAGTFGYFCLLNLSRLWTWKRVGQKSNIANICLPPSRGIFLLGWMDHPSWMDRWIPLSPASIKGFHKGQKPKLSNILGKRTTNKQWQKSSEMKVALPIHVRFTWIIKAACNVVKEF